MKYEIHNENAVSWAEQYDGEKFHALLTDAPYHLTSITKRFGKKNSKPAKHGKDGSFQRIGKGFMNSTWDSVDENGLGVSFKKETWEAFKKVLHPGAFGMAFSASRNWHRMAVAIEDAGFLIHPTMFFLWVSGQGFPKSTKIKDERFDGHKYGAQALKPAVEPIIIFQKPYEGKPVDNILSTGAGSINIEAGRIPLQPGEGGYIINRFSDGAKPFGNGAGHEFESVLLDSGRYPSNLIIDEGVADIMEEQREGTSKFFYTVSNSMDETDPFLYWNKASVAEKSAGLVDGNNHPANKPLGLCEYISKLLLPPVEYAPRRIFIPFSGVGSEMIGAGKAGWEEIVGVEFDKENGYVDIAEKRLNYWLKESK